MQRLENFLLFLTLFFLPTQLGKHFWPDFSFVYSIKVDYLSPTVYLWDLLVILLILSFIIQNKPINKLALNITLIFILACTISLLPLLASTYLINIGAGLVRVEQYLIAAVFGIYIASQNFKEVLQKLFWPLSISVIFISLLGIMQFFFAQSIGFWVFGERTFSISTPAIAKFDYHGWQFLRPYSTFSHPNVLAAFMLLILPLLTINSQTLNQKRIFYLSLVLGSLVTVLSVARTVLVAGIIGLSFFLKRKLILVLIGFLLVLSPFFYTRFASIKDFDSLSLSRREQMNEIALNIFLQNPFVGVGVNNFIPVASDQLLIGPSRFLQPVHNIYLLSLSETGILGIISLSLIFTSALYIINKSHVPAKTKHTLFLMWITITFLGLFDHYFLTAPQGYRLLFLIWGLSFATKNNS